MAVPPPRCFPPVLVIMPMIAPLLPDVPLPPMPVPPGLALEMPASYPAPGLNVLDATVPLHTCLLNALRVIGQQHVTIPASSEAGR